MSDRQRRSKRRRAAGRRVARIEVDEAAVEAVLEAGGHLAAGAGDDWRQVERALERLVAALIAAELRQWD